MRLKVVLAIATLLAARQVSAQCKVKTESNEARLLAFYSAPIVFSVGTAPDEMRPGTIRLGGEAEYIPKPDPAIEQTGACFTQKSEHTSLSPVFGRPRITIGVPLGFQIELAYLPPVTIAKATPNLFSFAVAHVHHFFGGPISNGTTLMFRGHGTFGNVKGPITCPRSSLQQQSASNPCFGTEPSEDTFHPDMFGGEVAASVAPGSGRVSFYAGAGANHLDPHFQVGFTNGNGGVDNTQVELEESIIRGALFGGVTALVGRILDLGAQVYSVPSDATLFRINGGIRFR